MDLQVYLNCLKSAIDFVDECITNLNLEFMGVHITLPVLIGTACMSAIIDAIVSPNREEYDTL